MVCLLIVTTVTADQMVLLAPLDLVTGLPVTSIRGHDQIDVDEQLEGTVHG
jgi:hypothetical protein